VSNRLPSRGRAAIVLLLLLASAVAAERGRWFSRLLAAGAPERSWVWVDAAPREVRPRAFFLVGDFELAAVPSSARLEIAGDPEYVVRLNGRRVGSGSYRARSAIDAYDLDGLLRQGRNRVAVEARSPIGSGGVTARIVDGEGRALVATDDTWRVLPGVWRLVANPDQPLPESPGARVLGRAPYARWGLPEVRSRPVYATEVERDELEPALAWRPARPAGGEWLPLPRRSREAIGGGELFEVDFGRQVAGYLHLDVQPAEAAEGMFFVAEAAGDALDRAPDGVVVAVPNLGFWQDVEPRRFRYATFVGLSTVRGVSVIPVRPDAEALRAPAGPPRGLLGEAIEPARSPLVEELRRSLLAEESPGG
jgi:hypothetical protein